MGLEDEDPTLNTQIPLRGFARFCEEALKSSTEGQGEGLGDAWTEALLLAGGLD